jgi:hypothetical protein
MTLLEPKENELERVCDRVSRGRLKGGTATGVRVGRVRKPVDTTAQSP